MKTIDHEKTIERCRLLNNSELARQLQVTPSLVQMVIHGTYPAMHSDNAQKILNKLRELGMLVEGSEQKAA
jgi:uncharacterized protein (DUF2342 family)